MTRSWLKECGVKQMSSTEAAWLAGFFDGEGSLIKYKAGRGRDRKYGAWKISVPNTFYESLEYCKNITGVGSISERKDSNNINRKTIWQWQLSAQRDINSICKQIKPYCIIKAEKINLFLQEWRDIPSVVELVDTFGLNPNA